MTKIKGGVIGIGAIGKNHVRVLSELPEAELTAVYDSDAALARQTAGQYGIKAAESLEEFAELVEAASVAVPTSAHFAIGSRLLELGRHILVEKPIADKADDAKALARLAHEHKRVLQVGHIERYNPVMSQLEEELKHPKFIEVHRLSPFPNRSLDIGVVLDLMIHDLEIILNLVRSPLASIDAVGVPVLTHREDIANARLRFENGCVANLTASRISPEKMRKIRIFQEDRYVSLDYQAQDGKIYRRDGLSIAAEEVAVEKGEPLKVELESFLHCVLHETQPKVSGSEAVAALELAMEVTRLIEQGGEFAAAAANGQPAT